VTGRKRGWTELHKAAWAGEPDAVTARLKAGDDPNMTDEEGVTPMHLASESSTSKSVIPLLLKAGAVPDPRDVHGNTPLMVAARHGLTETVTMLIESGADVRQVSENGNTALHIAADSGRRETVKVLLDAGADCNVRNSYGESPLHRGVLSRDDMTVRILIGDPVRDPLSDIEGLDRNDMTPLHLATKWSSEAVVNVLLDAGADPSVLDAENRTPLDLVSGNIFSETVRERLSADGPVDPVDGLWQKGETEKHEEEGPEAEEGTEDMSERLPESGPDGP